MLQGIAGNLTWGVIDAIIGFVVGLLLANGWSFWRARYGFLTGEWEQTIYDDQGQAVKQDRVSCRNVGKEVQAQIHRIVPTNESRKEWRVSGRIEGNFLFVVFWPKDLKKTPGSYGTIQLHMIDQNSFEGFYVRLNVSGDGSHFNEELTRIRLVWKRII